MKLANVEGRACVVTDQGGFDDRHRVVGLISLRW